MKGRFENITGNLQIKNGKYYVLVNLYDLSGKRTIKWVALGLDTKCGKKLARARMAEILEEYNSSQRRLMKAASKKKDPERFITEREKVQQMPVTEFLREWVRQDDHTLTFEPTGCIIFTEIRSSKKIGICGGGDEELYTSICKKQF